MVKVNKCLFILNMLYLIWRIYSNPRSEDVVIGYVATVDDDMSSNSGLLVGIKS